VQGNNEHPREPERALWVRVPREKRCASVLLIRRQCTLGLAMPAENSAQNLWVRVPREGDAGSQCTGLCRRWEAIRSLTRTVQHMGVHIRNEREVLQLGRGCCAGKQRVPQRTGARSLGTRPQREAMCVSAADKKAVCAQTGNACREQRTKPLGTRPQRSDVRQCC
jgi:hypothetical protein